MKMLSSKPLLFPLPAKETSPQHDVTSTMFNVVAGVLKVMCSPSFQLLMAFYMFCGKLNLDFLFFFFPIITFSDTLPQR